MLPLAAACAIGREADEWFPPHAVEPGEASQPSGLPVHELTIASNAAHRTAIAAPTAVHRRYGVLALSVSMAVILYLDRMAISVAMPAMIEDLGIPLEYVADSVAAFFWCYALFQIPAGWLGDRWGGRRALTLYVVAWSLAMAGMGFVGGLASLVVMRGVLGIGQAGAYATTASFLAPLDAILEPRLCQQRRFARRPGRRSAGPFDHGAGHGGRGPVWACRWRHWRPVFVVYGVVGLAWADSFGVGFATAHASMPASTRPKPR